MLKFHTFNLRRYLTYRAPPQNFPKYLAYKSIIAEWIFLLAKILHISSKTLVRWREFIVLVEPVNDVNIKECFIDIFGLGCYELVNDFSPQKGWSVVDVGAHYGFYTVKAAKAVNSIGKVLAIEAHPHNFRKLLFNVKINDLKNVICVNAISSDREGVGELYIHQQSGEHSIVFPSNKVMRIKQVTLDTLTHSLNFEHIDLLKIDVEGAEVKVLKGARKLLKNKRIHRIVAEVHTPSLLYEFLMMLRRYNFSYKVFPWRTNWLIYAKTKLNVLG